MASTTGTRIAAAVDVQAEMVRRDRGIADGRRRSRAPLVAIDRIIDGLELRHLQGRTAVDSRVCRQLEHLSALVPLNDDIIRAADTRTLHAALLDLQEHVLESVLPARRAYTLHDDR